MTFSPTEIPIFEIAVKLPVSPIYPMLAKGLLPSSVESYMIIEGNWLTVA